MFDQEQSAGKPMELVVLEQAKHPVRDRELLAPLEDYLPLAVAACPCSSEPKARYWWPEEAEWAVVVGWLSP